MTIEKSIMMIIVVALVVFSHGCVELFDSETINDSGTIEKYNEYIDLYNDDSQKYNIVANNWIQIENNYKMTMKGRDPIYSQLKRASDDYKSVANRIYTHLEVFEQFIILNEDALKRNNVSTVQLKGDIQEWKEEIRLNLN